MIRHTRNLKGFSDSVGYILILGIIISSISAVYFVGFDILNESRDIEEQRNIERTLSVFMDNEDEVVEGEAPSRSTEVKMNNNTVRTKDSTSRLFLYIPSRDESYIAESSSIVYSSPRGNFIYELGGIIRKSEDNDVSELIEKPNLIKYNSSTNTIHIQLLGTTTNGASVKGGVREIELVKTSEDIYVRELSSTEQVELYIRTPNILLWSEYYSEKPSIDSCEPYSADQIVCTTVPVDTVQVQQTSMRINIF